MATTYIFDGFPAFATMGVGGELYSIAPAEMTEILYEAMETGCLVSSISNADMAKALSEYFEIELDVGVPVTDVNVGDRLLFAIPGPYVWPGGKVQRVLCYLLDVTKPVERQEYI